MDTRFLKVPALGIKPGGKHAVETVRDMGQEHCRVQEGLKIGGVQLLRRVNRGFSQAQGLQSSPCGGEPLTMSIGGRAPDLMCDGGRSGSLIPAF